MDIGVVDPVKVGEHRHPRIGLDPRHQAFPSARHDHVDQPGGGQHRTHYGPVLAGNQLHRCCRHTCRDQAVNHCRVDCPV